MLSPKDIHFRYDGSPGDTMFIQGSILLQRRRAVETGTPEEEAYLIRSIAHGLFNAVYGEVVEALLPILDGLREIGHMPTCEKIEKLIEQMTDSTPRY